MHSFTAAVLAVVLLGTLGACSSVAGGRQLPLDHDAMTSSLVHVNPVAVWMPIGRFVLLRRDNDACALRFLEAGAASTKTRTRRRGTRGMSGSTSPTAEATSRVPASSTAPGSFSSVPSGGRGHFEFQTSEVTVKCGPFRQTWIYPAGFSLGRSPKHADPRLEAAQTKARDIGEVDVNDPRVTWYRYRLGPPPDFTRPIDQLY